MKIKIILFAIICTVLINIFFYYLRKKQYIRKSYAIVLEKYKLYNEKKHIVFNPVNSLMVRCKPDEYCAIYENYFILKGEKYIINKGLKISYSMPILTGHNSNRLCIYIDEKTFIFSTLVINLEDVMAFLVILHLIQNNIKKINSQIFNDILIKLKINNLV